MEIGDLIPIQHIQIVIFHSYVKLPEGNVGITMPFAPSPSQKTFLIVSWYKLIPRNGWFMTLLDPH